MWQPRETPARFLALGCGIALCALLASRHAWADGREWNALAAESNRQFEQGNHAAAERSARAALAHAERQFDAGDRRLVISLKNLAILYRYMPRFAEAEQLIARAREAGERAHWSAADLADLEREATNIYLAQFKYEEAAQTAEREVQLLEKHLEKWAPKPRGGKGLMGTARQAAQRFVDRVLGLSAIYLMSGNYALAEASALRGRRTCEEYLRDDAQLAAPWVSLADVYGATGRYRQEDAFLRAALSHLESKAPNHPGIGSVLVRVAGIAMHHGRLADAEAMLERALKIKGRAKAGDLFVELNSIALLRERQGRHAEAEATLLRIIADMERTEGATNPDLAVPLNNLARHYRTAGRMEEAAATYARARAIADSRLPEGHPVRASLKYSDASLHLERGNLDLAEPLLRQALTETERLLGPSHPLAAGNHRDLGILQAVRGDVHGARRSFRQGLVILQKVLEQYFAFLTERERLERLADADYFLAAFFTFCEAHQASHPELAGDMYDAILWRKGLVGRSVAELQKWIANDAALRTRLDRLRTARGRLSALRSAPRHDSEQWQTEVEKLESQIQSLDQELVRAVGPLARARAEVGVDWQRIRQSLRPGEAAVEFLRFERRDIPRRGGRMRYAALVLRPEPSATPRFVDLGDATALESGPYGAFRRSIGPTPPRLVPGEAASLHAAVWKPLEPLLGDALRVVLAPDGVLNMVPFDAIQLPSGERLIDRHDLRIVTNTRHVVRLDERTDAETSAILVGNPLFAMDENQRRVAAARMGRNETRRPMAHRSIRSFQPMVARAAPLPGTQAEILSIQALLAGGGWRVQARTGEHALEEFVKGVQRPRILHLATHGFFVAGDAGEGGGNAAGSLEDPLLRSGLLFAGAARASGLDNPAAGDLDDGVLTAYEASLLDLQGTELVVLSACETGIGEVRNGEGVFGLRRAFEVAGADAILMSLWSVPDEETHELMTLFYERWLGGTSKHEALRAAQKVLRARVRQRYAADLPFYWGAFVLVGR